MAQPPIRPYKPNTADLAATSVAEATRRHAAGALLTWAPTVYFTQAEPANCTPAAALKAMCQRCSSPAAAAAAQLLLQDRAGDLIPQRVDLLKRWLAAVDADWPHLAPDRV